MHRRISTTWLNGDGRVARRKAAEGRSFLVEQTCCAGAWASLDQREGLHIG